MLPLAMGYAIRLYEAFKEDLEKARLLAEAFEGLESRYPHLSDLATTKVVTETELQLRKEIEATRLQIKEGELRLQKEIEATRLQITEAELRLQKEIEATRLQIKEVEKQITEVELRLQKEIEATRLQFGQQIKEVEKQVKEVEKQVKEIEKQSKERDGNLLIELEKVRKEQAQSTAAQTKWIIISVTVIIAIFTALMKLI